MPYIYSEAWQISENGSTLYRPLVMDYKYDKKAVGQEYEYMFGKSFLVAPVTEPGVSEWDVYLPSGTSWFDFWTGKTHAGGLSIKTAAPLDKIPLFVKAGSIVPMGPIQQYTSEKPMDTLEIRIYSGADVKFELYEDESNNYNYEKGVYSTIRFEWNDKKKILTIGDRKGVFPGMLQSRVFKLVVAGPGKATGGHPVSNPDKAVNYTGRKLVLDF